MHCVTSTSSSSAAASPASRRRMSCTSAACRSSCSSAAPRAGGVILSEQIDGFTIDGGPDSLLMQKPEAIALCQELGLGDRLVPTKPPRLAYIQRGGRLHALPAASVLGIPTRIGPFVRTRLFSWPGKLRMGAELFVPATRVDERRIDRRVHDATVRREAADLPRRAAARRHPRRRRRSAVGPARCSRGLSKPSGRTAACFARSARRSSAGSPPAPRRTARSGRSPGGLSEMVRRARRGASRRRAPRSDSAASSGSNATRPGMARFMLAAATRCESRAVVVATPAVRRPRSCVGARRRARRPVPRDPVRVGGNGRARVRARARSATR